MFDAPGAAAEQQDTRAILFSDEGEFIDKSQLAAAVQDCEQRRRGEHRQQFHEMATAKGFFSLLSDGEHPVITPKDLFLQHPFDDFAN